MWFRTSIENNQHGQNQHGQNQEPTWGQPTLGYMICIIGMTAWRTTNMKHQHKMTNMGMANMRDHQHGNRPTGTTNSGRRHGK